MGHPRVLLEQAEDADAGGGADVDFAVGDRGSDELVAGAEMIAAVGGLVGVVDLLQIFRVVGVENRGIGVFHGPDDGVLAGIGGDAGSGAGIAESVCGFRHWAGEQPGVLELKRRGWASRRDRSRCCR